MLLIIRRGSAARRRTGPPKHNPMKKKVTTHEKHFNKQSGKISLVMEGRKEMLLQGLFSSVLNECEICGRWPGMCVCVCVCVCVHWCKSVFICVCVRVHIFMHESGCFLPVCANECEAGDYACVSKGTGVCSQELQGPSWGGYVYTVTPAFGGPGCLSETISFLCGPFESPKCDAHAKDRGHLHGPATRFETEQNQRRATSLNVLPGCFFFFFFFFNSLIPGSPPPHLSSSPISPPSDSPNAPSIHPSPKQQTNCERRVHC